MVEIKVESNNILKIEYSGKDERLKVWFKNSSEGTYYEYEDVPPKVFGELMLSQSKGIYFANNIKNIYEYKKVEG